ncbi:ParB N-terminal domain-containing protein [Leptospira mayottensis]|uniref:ParB N-terminal domain-containing protein n=1 Tax=Leptospira mayottensis TaxID=1137606 RepID=UPI000E3609F6|nr:ParB N-terminal domain-containing protein [Leptospira mayottensis]AXR66830.1 chromosome partitioning protein ParB [Leptospira mayottensis]AXR66843.1 chromosome partitioning protein ParB [Leptospira mayottensis]
MRSQEERAKEWMEMQEASPRPGSTFKKQYIPKGVTLNPIVKMVPPSSLKPNPKNDFDPLSEEEYANLKENIARNGILDALTAKKDGTIITGENRYRIALELKDHEDENVRRRVESIPVRYYMNELNDEEEYDILEGDNLFRRHLTAEQRKERLKRRILRKYKDDLLQDNRGGNRKNESSHSLAENTEEETKQERSSSPEKETELGLFGEVGTLEEQESLNEKLESGSKQESESLKDSNVSMEKENSRSKDDPHLLIGHSSKDLAKKVSENENIPLGTAKNYISELKKELKTKEPKPAKKKTEKKKETVTKRDKVKEFQKKYSKLSPSAKKAEVSRLVGKLIQVRKQKEKLEAQVTTLIKEDSEIVEKLASVGEKKRVQGL